MHHSTSVAIVGSGLAGISLAIRLSDMGIKTMILTKSSLASGSSLWAQGGIAAVLGSNDSFESHIEDTLTAGAGLCSLDTVKFVIEKAPVAISWLTEAGVGFDSLHDSPDFLHLTREGGHSHRRVAHVADVTGKAVVNTLTNILTDKKNLSILENHTAVDLVTSKQNCINKIPRVIGLYALDNLTNEIHSISADIVVLATGGASKAYLYTTNPETSTGDGIAMAWRAGCRVSNMEFVQFHPTCLFHPHAGSFLISEAIRGEGGQLILPNGEAFMHLHDKRKELAPRDIVARAIDYEIKKGGFDCVYLDITSKSIHYIKKHFPAIYEKCLSLGIDITHTPIPVVPAAHYICGGIITDLSGKTDLNGLYALGENAHTGLHGANRLASNSLLECLVFSEQASFSIKNELEQISDIITDIETWDESRVTQPIEQVVISHNWDELRHFMWNYVGIVRSNERLTLAAKRLKMLTEEIAEFYGKYQVNKDLLELRNLVLVSQLIVSCASKRAESRGLHYTLDYPNTEQTNITDTILDPNI